LAFVESIEDIQDWHGICSYEVVKGNGQNMKHETATFGIEFVALGEASVEKAQMRVVACQSCSPSVSRAFGSVLTEVLGATALATEYLVCAPAQCPNCGQPIDERTMVRCEGECGELAPPTLKDFLRVGKTRMSSL